MILLLLHLLSLCKKKSLLRELSSHGRIWWVAVGNYSAINTIFKEDALTERYSKVITTTTEPIVSSDIVKSPFASTVDLSMTRVVDGDLLKVMAWYDNLWGFTN